MVGRTQLVATLRYSNTCRNHYSELLVLGAVTTDAARAEAAAILEARFWCGIVLLLQSFLAHLW